MDTLRFSARLSRGLARRRRTILASLAAIVVAIGTVLAITTPAQAAGICDDTTAVALNVGIQTGAYIPSSEDTIAGLTCSMYQGNTGAGVKRLQINLNKCYASFLINGISGSGVTAPGVLSEDGQFGPKTKAGLTLAQFWEHQRGLAVTANGEYGSATRDNIQWYGSWYTDEDGKFHQGCARLKQPLAITSLPAPPTTPTGPPTCLLTSWVTLDRTVLHPEEQRPAALVPSVGQSVASLDCALSQGATGMSVSALQENLNACYRNELMSGYGGFTATGLLSVDGQFGPLTKRALQMAQTKAGILNNGSYGTASRDGLKWNGHDVCVKLKQPLAIYTSLTPVSDYAEIVSDWWSYELDGDAPPSGVEYDPFASAAQMYNLLGWVQIDRPTYRTSLTLSGGWRFLYPNYFLYPSLFELFVYDCTAEVQVAHEYLNYPTVQSMELQSDSKSVTIGADPTHVYRAKIIGDGSFQRESIFRNHFTWADVPDNIERFIAETDCI